MQEKILTISIAAYNVSAYIRNTLDSLLINRNRNELEVLIINDGSLDDTSQIAREYEKKYPTTFRVIDKTNGGHGSTINFGMEHAKGKYFKVLDGDDWFDNKELEEFIEELKFIDVDLVLTNYVEVFESGKFNPVYNYSNLLPRKECQFMDLSKALEIEHTAITVKTLSYKKYKFKLSEKCFYEDMEYNCYAIYQAKSIIYIDRSIYQYRLGTDGQSVALVNQIKNVKMMIKIALKLQDFYKNTVITNDNIEEMKKKCIKQRVKFISNSAFASLLLDRNGNNVKQNLFDYLGKLEQYELFSELLNEKWMIKLLYKIHFMYYPISYLYKLYKFRKERKIRGMK